MLLPWSSISPMHITSNTTEVASLDVAYPATTSWMLALAQLTHLLRAYPTVPIVDFARPEEWLVLPHIDKPLCFCKPKPPNVTVTGHRSVLRDKQLGQFHAKCQGTAPQGTSLPRSFDKTLHNVSIVHTELNECVCMPGRSSSRCHSAAVCCQRGPPLPCSDCSRAGGVVQEHQWAQ